MVCVQASKKIPLLVLVRFLYYSHRSMQHQNFLLHLNKDILNNTTLGYVFFSHWISKKKFTELSSITLTTNFLECSSTEWVICSGSFMGLISVLLNLWRIHEPFLIYLDAFLSRTGSPWSTWKRFHWRRWTFYQWNCTWEICSQVFKINSPLFWAYQQFYVPIVLGNIQPNYSYIQSWVCAQEHAGPALAVWALQHCNRALFSLWSFAIHFRSGKPSSITESP